MCLRHLRIAPTICAKLSNKHNDIFEIFVASRCPLWLRGVAVFLDWETGIGNRESETGKRESGIGNRELGIRNRELEIGNPKSEFGNLESWGFEGKKTKRGMLSVAIVSLVD